MNPIAAIPLLILCAGILLQLIAGRWLKPVQKGGLAFSTGLLAFAGTLALLPAVLRGEPPEVTLFSWDPLAVFQLHIDGLSLLFALMATGIGSAILLYCIRYMAHEPQGVTRFYALMLTFIAGLLGLVGSANLLTAYLCWEVIGLCSYFLVGFWYRDSAAVNGARKVLLMTHLPGYALLIAILLLYSTSGTLLWTDPALAGSFTTTIFLFMLVAAMAKSVMFPLHTWIPEAMNAPTPVSALLHSACYVKAGVYLIARLYSITPWQPGWNTLVLALGCVTMLVGALFALTQTDLKRLLAYSTISQLGYIITGLGLGSPLGLAAGLFYCFSHGLFKGTLFLCAGAVQHAAGTRDMRQLGGLARRMPHTARIWLIASAAIIGVPLSNGFVAKWLLYDAALESGAWAVVIIAWLVSTLTAFYILKATTAVFYGNLPAALRQQDVQEAAPSMRAGMGFLAFLCVVFGLAPQILLRWVVAPATAAQNVVWPVNLTFLGVHTTSAGAPVTLGAGLTVLALLIAALIYRAARPSRRTGVSVFSGGDPFPIPDDALGAEDISEIVSGSLQPVYRATDPDPLYRTAWKTLKALAVAWTHGYAVLERRPLLSTLAFAALALLLVWVL